MLELTHVIKHFGSVLALDDVTFTVPSDQIIGSLSSNGAGKSTCLRILAGLVTLDEGDATVSDMRYADLPNLAATVGSLLSAEGSHPERSGLGALRMATLTLGLPWRRAGEVLTEVGLSDAEARHCVGAYSLGMRQQLGVAQALLGDPQVLILDEPANGLDPQGQRRLFDLLRSRAACGCAVLPSSHQLHEVSRLAHRVVTIGGGRLLTDHTAGDDTGLEEQYFTLTSGTDHAARPPSWILSLPSSRYSPERYHHNADQFPRTHHRYLHPVSPDADPHRRRRGLQGD